jgi:hypothetical protein
MTTRDIPVVGRGVAVEWLRVVILLVGSGIMLVPLLEGAVVATLLLLWPAVLAAAYAPASPAPAGVVVVAAVLVTLLGGDPLRAGVLVLIPLVHLFHVTCGIAGTLPTGGRLHLDALRAPLLRLVAVQAVMAGLVVLVAVLPDGRTSALVEAAALAGLAAVTLLVLWQHRVK